MTTKVVRVTFPDGVRMYATYSTTSDNINSDLLLPTESDANLIEHPELIPDDLSSKDVLAAAWVGNDFDAEEFSEVEKELVQCEVLLYPDTIWESHAKRKGRIGVITGFKSSMEYIKYWEEIEIRHGIHQQANQPPAPAGLWARLTNIFR